MAPGSERPEGAVRRRATVALGLQACALAALASLHVLRPEDAPATSFVSNYAVGPYGWVMTSFFLAFSVSLATLVAALHAAGVRGLAGGLGLCAFVVSALGLVVTAIYPTDLPGAPHTLSGDIHEWSFRVNVLGLLVGVLALTAALARPPVGWMRMGPVRALALAVTLVLALQFATLRKGMPYGLVNRLLVLVVFAWLGVVGYRLRHGGATADPR